MLVILYYLLWFFLDVFGVLMDSKLSILLSLVDLTLFDPPPDMDEPPLGAIGESRMVVREAERPLLLKRPAPPPTEGPRPPPPSKRPL